MELHDIFTRETCECTIVGDVATVSVQSRARRIEIDMPVSTLVANMAACALAIQKWEAERQAQIIPLPKRGRRHAALPSKSS